MKRILSDIRSGEFKKAYLLFGEEDYLRNQFRDNLKKALVSEGDTMNFTYYEGKDVNVKEMIDLAETMPFLSDRRVILLENTGLFKSGGDELASYLESPCESTYFIFSEREIDKRSKAYKAVTKLGIDVEFAKQDEMTLLKWIKGKCNAEKKNISDENIRYFLEKVGTDMEALSSELEKLFCYCLEKPTITSSDIDDICVTKIENHIFAMTDALATGNKKFALEKYYELLANKESPMYILYMITRHCNNLLMMKELRSKGMDIEHIAEKTKQRDFVVKKALQQANKFTLPALKEAVEKCVQAEEDFKTGRVNDRLAVELLLMSVF